MVESLEDLYNRFFQRYPSKMNLCGLDLETTGFASNAKIIEIGAIAVINTFQGVKFKNFETLINPGELISDKITEVTKITNTELQSAPSEKEAYVNFENWFEALPDIEIFVAHNAGFDRSKLANNLTRMNSTIKNKIPPFQCTMQMARKMLTKTANDKLETVCEYYNFQNKMAHRALTDAEAALYIFGKMMMNEYE
jgi:DNA polymerase III epsilon subunit family exonuclease